MKSRYFTLIVSLFFSIGLLNGCSDSSGKNNQQKNKLIPAVEAVQTGYGALPLVERLSGVVRAKNQVDIYAEISAIVSDVHVNNGDKVKQGDRLVTLRQKEFVERLNQAKASLQIAEAQAKQSEARYNELQLSLKRYESLSEKGLTSEAEFETIKTEALSAQADFDLSKARVAQAKANVAEVDENLSKTVIRSPISGMVGSRNAEVGMTVGSSTKLFTVGQLDTVIVEVILTDRMLNYIETGQRSDIISTTLPSGSVSSKLTRIS
ncbi:MAG: efflux RND transporter periplasmic adaptor subunit, partial [Calditrichaeota bacterium]